MSEARIRFSTDILRRLGEELNPSPDQGIIELVKNAYDANASQCVVRLLSTSEPGGNVEIIDDGDGMNAKAIQDNWLVLGRSKKSKSQRTRLNRIPAGSKGLGRLAALRMGKSISLLTKPRSNKSNQFSLNINWSDFDKVDVVEDVFLDIEEINRKGGASNGTEIKINSIDKKISRWDVKRLARAMILLSDPFEDNPIGFQPVLEAPEYKDLEKLVKNRYMDSADFHLIASLDEKGYATAKVTDWRDRVLFETGHEELASNRNSEIYRAPSATFNIWVFILNKSSFDTKSVGLTEVREWLKEFGGIHLYENGLRVQPYGNPGNDWLDINLSRAKSPEERPSTNTSVGKVTVTDTESILDQKTDRSGFIESDSFIELRSFAQDALEWMARCRMDLAKQRRDKAKEENEKIMLKSKGNLESVIQEAPKAIRQKLDDARKKTERATEKKIRDLQREIQLYRTLSTAGITTATFAHESSGSPLKILASSLGTIERRAKKSLPDNYDSLFLKPINSIKKAISSLSFLGTTTLNLLNQSKRRIGRVDIHDVIENVFNEFSPFIDGRGVVVNKELSNSNPYLRGSEAALESVITNLLNNSLTAFERSAVKKREILVRSEISDGWLDIHIADSGPGIEGISKRYIWLPGQTTQENGTGLGLTIVYDSVKDLGGKVEAIEHGVLGGAEFIIKLPILGK